jgi:osmotically-inducible protein OsmY
MASIPKFTLGLAAGAAIAYLFDPVSGRGRRTRLADQLKAEARDAAEEAGRRTRFQAGRLKGAVHDLVASGTDMPENDTELLQKIRSEAVGPSSLSTSDVEIDIANGEVTVRAGTIDETALQDLLSRIRSVTGVRRVHAPERAA